MRHLDQRSSFTGKTWDFRLLAAGLALVLSTFGMACWAQQARTAPNGSTTRPEHSTPERERAASPETGDSWGQLTTPQQRVLEPLKDVWPSMSDARHRKWRLIADRMGALPPDAQQRLRSRMLGWARLTADQRAEARMAYLRARSDHPRDALESRRTANTTAAGLRPVSPGLVQVTPGATTVLVHSPLKRGTRR